MLSLFGCKPSIICFSFPHFLVLRGLVNIDNVMSRKARVSHFPSHSHRVRREEYIHNEDMYSGEVGDWTNKLPKITCANV